MRTSPKDYRPISLYGSIYKILAKVLAGRFQKVLTEFTSNEQGAFVANECMHSRNRKGIPGLMSKLDLEKAYDRLDWASRNTFPFSFCD